MSYPQIKIGKQVRRADGVLVEEVITTSKEGSRLVTTTAYRPVGQKTVASVPNKPKKSQEVSEVDLDALLGEDGGSSSDEEQVVGARPAVAAAVAPSEGGEMTTMEKLGILKQCLQEGILTQEEYDFKRKQVLDAMMNAPRANPSRVEGREARKASPETVRKQQEAEDAMYIQNRYKHAYEHGKEGSAREKNPTMQMQPTGIDGLYFTGKDVKVVQTLEEKLPDRRVGPEHKFQVVKTTVKKELLDNDTVRVTKTENFYDGYSGAYVTQEVSMKMKPKLYFHKAAEEDDPEFEMREGTMATEGDKVERWNKDFNKDRDEEYQRVMNQGLEGKSYQTRVVNNNAGKGDFGWDGVYRYAGEKPEDPKKKSKGGLFGKKKAAAKDPNDKWAGFEDSWDQPEEEGKGKAGGKFGGKKPGYKDGEKKGLFRVKKAQPKPSPDKNMGEDVAAYKQSDPTKNKDGEREYLWDDGSGMAGFGSGEQWGSQARQHEGKHAAGGSFHNQHHRGGYDMWK